MRDEWDSRAWPYGWTGEQLRWLFDVQGGCCAGCGTPVTLASFLIDHDHVCCQPPAVISGRYGYCGRCVRGLVCISCNVKDVLKRAHSIMPPNMTVDGRPARHRDRFDWA